MFVKNGHMHYASILTMDNSLATITNHAKEIMLLRSVFVTFVIFPLCPIRGQKMTPSKNYLFSIQNIKNMLVVYIS